MMALLTTCAQMSWPSPPRKRANIINRFSPSHMISYSINSRFLPLKHVPNPHFSGLLPDPKMQMPLNSGVSKCEKLLLCSTFGKTEMNYAAWMFGLLKLQAGHDREQKFWFWLTMFTWTGNFRHPVWHVHASICITVLYGYFWRISPESSRIQKRRSSNTRPSTSLKFMRLPSLRERRFGITCRRFHVPSPRGENTERGGKYGKSCYLISKRVTLHQPNTCQWWYGKSLL